VIKPRVPQQCMFVRADLAAFLVNEGREYLQAGNEPSICSISDDDLDMNVLFRRLAPRIIKRAPSGRVAALQQFSLARPLRGHSWLCTAGQTP
jgi:hypothetical protein